MSAQRKTANKKAAKIARRPVYGVWTKVRVLETGEERLALVASHPIDRRICKERKYRAGDEVRMELMQSRNVKFHRLLHAIGGMLVKHVAGFEGLDAHGAIKRVQRESGVCCEEMEMDASPVVSAILSAARSLLGDGAARMLSSVLPEIKTITVKVPESTAFDDMCEERFRELYDGVTTHIVENYWPDMPRDAIEEMALMMQGDG